MRYSVTSTIHHGRFLADAAERMLEKTNEYAMACGEDGKEHDCDEIIEAELGQSEAIDALKIAIYEFRKRAEDCGV